MALTNRYIFRSGVPWEYRFGIRGVLAPRVAHPLAAERMARTLAAFKQCCGYPATKLHLRTRVGHTGPSKIRGWDRFGPRDDVSTKYTLLASWLDTYPGLAAKRWNTRKALDKFESHVDQLCAKLGPENPWRWLSRLLAETSHPSPPNEQAFLDDDEVEQTLSWVSEGFGHYRDYTEDELLGECMNASKDLTIALRSWGFAAVRVNGWVEVLTDVDGEEDWVETRPDGRVRRWAFHAWTELDGYIIDLTARQFNQRRPGAAPFPEVLVADRDELPMFRAAMRNVGVN